MTGVGGVRGAGVLLAAALLAGCSSGDGLAAPGQGYVDGAGTTREIAAAERTPAVELSGETVEGEPVDLADLRGSVVVLNVWYADCPPCRAEAPTLQGISEDYAAQGVRFLGINTRNDSPEAVRAFHETFGVTYPSIRDSAGTALLALRERGIAAVATPTTVVLDAQGRIAAAVAGQVEAGTLTDMIDRVLTEQPAAGTPAAEPSAASAGAAG
ncbi:TlpA disulfide reductase family protein [Kineococcus glutinatus]|uniref:TlpA disulfide reductase family protein n=1 Tax=Kineococcus glutinatus TaxID=1070872 RepID=A0ABP9HM20_9ACTN